MEKYITLGNNGLYIFRESKIDLTGFSCAAIFCFACQAQYHANDWIDPELDEMMGYVKVRFFLNPEPDGEEERFIARITLRPDPEE